MKLIIKNATPLLIVIILVVGLSIESRAQQQVQLTQYMFNGLILNPAYAGADGALNLTAVNRSQWSGIDGAPVTQTFSAHTLFNSKKIGLGLSIANDKIGVHKNFTALGSWAYHLEVSEKYTLSFGLQAGINQKRSDYLSLGSDLQSDPNQFQNISNTFFDLGAGLYFRTPTFQVGFSVPKIIPATVSVNDTKQFNLNQTHYYLFSKYIYHLKSNLVLEPSILLKYLPGVPLSYDLNANLIINNVFTTGLSYRKKESVDFLFAIKVTPQLRVGYSFDFPLGNITNISSGSHELMIQYIFKFTDTVASPR